MDQAEKFIIDATLQAKYILTEKKRAVIALLVFAIPFSTLLLFNVVNTNPNERAKIIGVTLFFTVFFGGIVSFIVLKRVSLLEQSLTSEFCINSESIRGFNKLRFNKTFYFKDIYIVKETRLGMFVVKGRFSYWDLHAKNGPLRFFYDRSIFIPKITKDYARFISLIKQNKKPDVNYHSSV